MDMYAKVIEEETGSDLEVPVEASGGVLLTSLHVVFPKATSLKYETSKGSLRILKVVDGIIQPPVDDQDWSAYTYYVVYPRDPPSVVCKEESSQQGCSEKGGELKEKESDGGEKGRRLAPKDIIVLNLPYETTVDGLRDHFSTYGELDFVEVKKDKEGSSRGFGFIRFATIASQRAAQREEQFIGGRQVTLMRPTGQQNEALHRCNNRIFIAKLSADVQEDDLREYFEKYGKVVDVFVPPRQKGIGFVSFGDVNALYEVFDEGDHIVKGCPVAITVAKPKMSSRDTRGYGSLDSYMERDHRGPGGGGPMGPYRPGAPYSHSSYYDGGRVPYKGYGPGQHFSPPHNGRMMTPNQRASRQEGYDGVYARSRSPFMSASGSRQTSGNTSNDFRGTTTPSVRPQYQKGYEYSEHNRRQVVGDY